MKWIGINVRSIQTSEDVKNRLPLDDELAGSSVLSSMSGVCLGEMNLHVRERIQRSQKHTYVTTCR